jgi:hypothetical protein
MLSVVLLLCVKKGIVMRGIYFKVIFIGITIILSQVSYAGKKQCQTYLDKLRNVQSQQKQGHSLKRAESLNKQESKARKIWWQCEQGYLKNKKLSTKKKQKTTKRQRISSNTLTDISKVIVKPFQMTAPLVVKSHYQGKQLQAWLLYYRQPKKCSRSKTTKQFAFCVEDRRNQQRAFEKSDATVKTK